MTRQKDLLSTDMKGTYQSDEIDLVQLWLILAKRRALIFSTCILCLLGGAALAFLPPAKFIYSTSIEIGTTLVSNGTGIVSSTIEPPEVVLAKINESYIPLAIAQMTTSDDVDYVIEAKNPKASNLVLLSSKGPQDMAETYRKLHELVTKPVMAEHLRIIEVPRRGFQLSAEKESLRLKDLEDPRIFGIKEKDLLIQVEDAQNHLNELEDQKKLLLSQEKRLAETQDLLRKQVNKVEKNLDQAHASRAQATASVGSNEAQAMTLLMIMNQVEQNERRLSELQERLNIGLEHQKQVLQKDIAANSRASELQKERIAKVKSQLIEFKAKRDSDQLMQKNVINSIENKISELQETRTLGLAVRSVKPSGPGKKIILTLAGILGLFGGVTMALVVELISNARRRMNSVAA